MAQADEFDAARANFNPPIPESVGQIMAALEQSVEAAAGYLKALDAGKAGAAWRMTLRGHEVFAMPRMLDVPLPVVYGRTADENPFR